MSTEFLRAPVAVTGTHTIPTAWNNSRQATSKAQAWLSLSPGSTFPGPPEIWAVCSRRGTAEVSPAVTGCRTCVSTSKTLLALCLLISRSRASLGCAGAGGSQSRTSTCHLSTTEPLETPLGSAPWKEPLGSCSCRVGEGSQTTDTALRQGQAKGNCEKSSSSGVNFPELKALEQSLLRASRHKF